MVLSEDISDEITRREFLRDSAAVASAPFILSSSLGASPVPANERITIGFIGMGKRGHTLLGKCLKFDQAQVVAVSEVEPERRAHAKKQVEGHYGRKNPAGFKGCAAHVDFRELLAREDIDAVVIATPDHWHAIPVIQAARAGKDIYCEKPLSLTIHEARRMADVVREEKRVFQTGSQQRSECGGRFHRACELIRNGRIGDVQDVYAGVGDPSRYCDLPEEKVPEGLDWNRWLGPAPHRGYHHDLCPRGMHGHYPAWRRYKDYSGGGMTDWGAHHFDIVQWGLGMDASGPVEIIPPDGKSHKTLTYRYAGGVELHHGGANGVLFVGTRGWIEVNRGHLKASNDRILKEEIGDRETRLTKASDQMGNWLECIRTRKDPICHAEIGCRSVTVCHLGNLAYWHNRSLKWDPEKYRFIGDDEANTWLDRPRRDPWKELA